MKNNHHKAILMFISSAAFITIFLSFIIGKRLIVEEWYLHILTKGGVGKMNASERLADLKSLRAIPLLLNNCENEIKDYQLRLKMAMILKRIGPSVVPYLCNILEKNSVELDLKYFAAEVMSEFGCEAKEAVPALIKSLKNADCGLRLRSVYALESIGGDSNELIIAYIDTLNDSDYQVRIAAVEAISKLHSFKLVIIPLKLLLKDRDSRVRQDAAKTLGTIGIEAREAVPALIESLRDSDENVKLNAIEALPKIDLSNEESIKSITAIISDDSFWYKEAAIRAIGKFGKNAEAAIPVIINSLHEGDSGILSSAAVALPSISKGCISSLVYALKNSEDYRIRMAAAQVLGMIGSEAKIAVFSLVDSIKDSDSNVRLESIRAINKIGLVPQYAISLLRNIADEDDVPEIRSAALSILSGFQ